MHNQYYLAQQIWKDRDWLIDRRADCQTLGADDYLIRYMQAAIDTMANVAIAFEGGDWDALDELDNFLIVYPKPPLAIDGANWTDYGTRVEEYANDYHKAVNRMLGAGDDDDGDDITRADVLP